MVEYNVFLGYNKNLHLSKEKYGDSIRGIPPGFHQAK